MALRFYNEHRTWGGSGDLLWRLEIWDSAFSGDPYEFKVSGGADFDYRADGVNDITAPVLGSSCGFTMMIQDATHEDLITDMASANEGRFTVRVERDGEFYWAGVINAPEVSFEDQYYPYEFRITAVDGLALLKNYPYTQGQRRWEDKFEGQSKFITIISRCLKKLPHIATHFEGAEKFIVTAINWYSDQSTATPSATDDPFWDHFLDNRAFSTGQSTGNGKFLSCYEVISAICTAFGARIALFDGYWLVEQIEHRSATIGSNANYSRYYDYDLTEPLANTLDDSQDIGGGTSLPKAAGGSFSLTYPLRTVRVTQTVNSMANLIGGAVFSSDAPATFAVGSIYGNGGLSYVRFTAGVEWSLENIDLPTNATIYGFFALSFELGGKWAKRDVVFQTGGTYTFTAVTWESSGSDFIVPIKLELAAVGETWTGQGNIDLFFRADDDFEYGDLVVSFDISSVEYYTGGTTVTADPADYTLDWAMKDPYCVLLNSVKVLLASVGAVYPKTATWEVVGDTANTEEKEIKTLIGDRTGDVLNQWGGVLFFDDPNYIYTSQWGNRNGTRDKTLAQLLAQRVLSGMYFPRKTYRGSVIGNTLVVQTPVSQSSERYLLTSGRYNTETDTLNGEWQRLVYTSAEFTYNDVEYDSGSYEGNGPSSGSASGGGGSVDNGNGGSGGGPAGGATIYSSDGTITEEERIVTIPSGGRLKFVSNNFQLLLDDDGGAPVEITALTSIQKSAAIAGDSHTIAIDDGSSGNTLKLEVAEGILLQSTGDRIMLDGETAFTDVIGPTTLNADADDYAGLDGANVGRLTASTAVNITGLASGSAGRLICLHNTGSHPITLVNASGSSTAANQFDIGSDYTIRADHACLLQYDAVDSRWRIVSTYALGRWEEAYTTSTATTASLTATAPATNIGAAIVPKGTGAFTLAVADGSSTGGNARGVRSVDLQTDRNAAAQVASGARAFVSHGRRNTASGDYSFAGGDTSTASGGGAFAVGGRGVIGGGATASANDSFAFGTGANASAANAMSMGPGSTASAQSAVAFQTSADKYEEFATINGAFLGLSRLVTGTAATELFLDGSSLTATIPSGQTWIAEINCVARVVAQGNGTVAANDTYAAVYRCVIANKGGTTALIGTVDTEMAAKSDASMSDVVFTITADNTGDYLKVTYTAGANSGSTTQANTYAKMKIHKF